MQINKSFKYNASNKKQKKRGVVVTRLIRSAKLLYAGPG